MTRKNHNKIISVVHPICCGLDVHKKMVSASIIISVKILKMKAKYLGFSLVPVEAN